MDHAFAAGVYLRSLITQDHKYLFTFSSRKFIILSVVLTIVIPFELIYEYSKNS